MKDPGKRIEELEAQLRQTSRNSSKPPGQDLSRRKGSFGINSPSGALFVERILTIAVTASRRGPDWLPRSIQANLDEYHAPAPGA